MKKLFTILLAALTITACTNDNEYDLDYFTQKYKQSENPEPEPSEPDTLFVTIVYDDMTASVTGDIEKVAINQTGADVTVTSASEKYLQLTVSGESTDGSLLVYSQRAWGLVMNGLTLTNQDGPAINNQCSKWLYVTLSDNTENTLADGGTYTEQEYDQKGTFFSEGQMQFLGTGKLNVKGSCKNGIACDDYIVIDDGTLVIDVTSVGGRGIKVNDGITINGGTTTITTSGKCKVETVNGVRDTTSAAGIKSDSLFVMNAGSLTITSKGDGGKGVNSTDSVIVKGGTINITTTGSNDVGKPKGVKSDKAIVVSGGSFTVKVSKSWACDNGNESEEPADRVTVIGTPLVKTLQKRAVDIRYE